MTQYIYAIKNNLNNKVYIGRTENTDRSWKKYKYDAAKRLRQSPLFTAMWNDGIENFSFHILKELPDTVSDDTLACEQDVFRKQFNSENSDFGYNVMPSDKHGKLPPVITDKMSANRIGITPSIETRAKMVAAHTGITMTPRTTLSPLAHLTMGDANKIREVYALNKYTEQEIADQFNTSRASVQKIIKNEIYKESLVATESGSKLDGI
jgi:group I intron endonuclease